MDKKYLLIKNYKDDKKLRTSFNELAKKIFGLDFEDWYQNGYWGENYMPYSIADGEKIIANISVNIMDFACDGKRKHYIQLGTVMTDEAYRHQGLSRFLMEKIIKEYREQIDGIFLFANNNVLNFYPKLGFQKSKEYQYSKTVQNVDIMSAVPVPMRSRTEWKMLEAAMKNSICNGSFEMAYNPGLIMFYITKFMKECVYYVKDQDAYVIAQMGDKDLLIHNIYSNKVVDLNSMIKAFGSDIKQVTLGFTPWNTQGYIKSEVQREDDTLFVMGKDFENFDRKRKMFPTLSHA